MEGTLQNERKFWPDDSAQRNWLIAIFAVGILLRLVALIINDNFRGDSNARPLLAVDWTFPTKATLSFAKSIADVLDVLLYSTLEIKHVSI